MSFNSRDPAGRDKTMQLSEHFTLEEFTASQTATRRGLNNTPSPQMIEKLKQTAQKMEQVRDLLGKPISINSAYRSPSVNRAIGGAATSQHCKGEFQPVLISQ